MRIVSLLPSATKIVCCLGLEEDLVGVTHECDYPPSVRTKPKVTRTHIAADAPSGEIDRLVRGRLAERQALYSLDFETLRRLEPDLLITQTLCDVCAVAESEVRAGVAQLAGSPRVVNLEPTRLGEVLDSILTVGEATANVKTAQQVVRVCKERIARVRSAVPPDMPPKKVVVLEWLDPLFSCGHWTPELVEIAGGVEPLVQPGMRSRELSAGDVAAVDPDVILIACCGFGVARAMQDVPSFMELAPIAELRCVREGRVYLTDGSAYFSRPGPRLVDSLEILANAMDPQQHRLSARVPAASRVQPLLEIPVVRRSHEDG